jgi:hypothetical protein
MATVFYTAATLDGFLATDNHSLQWLFDVPGAAETEATVESFAARCHRWGATSRSPVATCGRCMSN